MQNNKSYNAFKMWGSWIGFVLGLLFIFVEDVVFIVHPFSYLLSLCSSAGDEYNCRVKYGLIILITMPIISFIYGWIVHSIFRKIS